MQIRRHRKGPSNRFHPVGHQGITTTCTFNCGPFRPISWLCGFHSHVVVAAKLVPFPLISCQILSTLHIFLCMGLIRLPMFHTSLPEVPFAGRLAERPRQWTAGFPRSRRLSRPATSAADGGGGRQRFGSVASPSVANLCFPGLALGFVGQPQWWFWPAVRVVRVGICRLGPSRRGFESLQTTFPMN